MSGSKYWTKPENFIGGCSPCSEGCAGCWAADVASKRLSNHPLYKGLTKNGKWTGEIRVMPELIKVTGGAPKTIFWCDMSDIFHKKVKFVDIDTAFMAMFDMPQHRHLVLTKRIDRAAEFCAIAKQYYRLPSNLWLGVTVCNQQEADEKIPQLLQIPAAHRWLSIEPMLGEIELRKLNIGMTNAWQMAIGGKYGTMLDWVVVGAESGPKARHCRIQYIRDIVAQCKRAGVPVFVKQVHLIDYDTSFLSKDPSQWPEDLRLRQKPKDGTDAK